MSANEKQDRHRLVKLSDASAFPRWQSSLQDHFFHKIHNTSMDKLTRTKTLDADFFKKEAGAELAAACKTASKDDENKTVDPMTNAGFADQCFEYAIDTGEGFHPWLYTLYADVRSTLSDKIKDQTASVRRGDLVGLLAAVKLSLRHYEIINPDDLAKKHADCTMEGEGDNDLMTYLAALSHYMQRLAAAGEPVMDRKARRILLTGLNQDIFETFITARYDNPCTSYSALEARVQVFAAQKGVLAKLDCLKPGNPRNEAVFATRAAKTADAARMDKLEAILVSMQKAAPKNPRTSSGEVCQNFTRGHCRFGDKCKFVHDKTAVAPSRQRGPNDTKWCDIHETSTHDSADCRLSRKFAERPAARPGVQSIHTARGAGTREGVQPTVRFEEDSMYGYNMSPGPYESGPRESACVMRRAMPEYVFAMRDAPKLNKWCVDGAATIMATYDRGLCFDIRPCNVTVLGPDSEHDFVCREMGSVIITVFDSASGVERTIRVLDVLINSAFPFHIFSEIIAFDKGATCVKAKGSWLFKNRTGDFLFHASQQLLGQGDNSKLYFIDEAVKRRPALLPASQQVLTAVGSAAPSYGGQRAGHSTSPVPLVGLSPTPAETSPSSGFLLPPQRSSKVSMPAKISTAKNLHMLLELHCAHDHWNFADVAARYGLTLPTPVPDCWACLMAKPRAITHDKVSTRVTSRACQAFAADAKGPIRDLTPEGFQFFFLIVCLFSSCYWTVLAKSVGEWKTIWPNFVKKMEARSGSNRSVSLLITDGHKSNMAQAIQDFNDDRGIETVTTAPYSQWQDPAERGIQTVSSGARASLIHGGGHPFMWGWAVLHCNDSTNRMHPPQPVAGHEGKSRLEIADPSVTAEKLMRTHKPLLCLCFKTVPMKMRGSNFDPHAGPCLHLVYDKTRKSYALLTIPNLYLTWSVEVRHLTSVFPLRVTNHLTNQLDTFMRPTLEDDAYASLHGPGNLMRRHRPSVQSHDTTTVVQPTPVLVRDPNAPTQPGPAWSSSRGYRPTDAALQALASVNVAQAGQSLSQRYTPDQLAARTPRGTKQALTGPDAVFWRPAVLKDFAVQRTKGCFINITDQAPPGPPPPRVEQRFKIKYRSEVPIALDELDPGWWKARTVARGDHFIRGQHYDATAAPVIHTPALKMLVAWAVARGLLLWQWDQEAAFYCNKMDRTGVIVRLPVGYDPYSDELRPLHLPPLYGELANGLPGIPQGSLLQYRAIAPDLRAMGFRAAEADNCLFVHDDGDMATSLHVDDGVLAAPSLQHAERVLGLAGLGRTRKLTWSSLHSTLGVDFDVDYSAEKRVVFMSQRNYAVTILERAGMLDCNSARTPGVPGRAYTKAHYPVTDEQKTLLATKGLTKELYHSVTASLNFLVSITRPDMLFVQGKMAKYCSNPGQEHFDIQKHALRFLKGTLGYGIEFVWRASDPPPVDGPLNIVAWSDSSFADDIDTGRTTLGHILQVNGTVVSASSKLGARVDSCVNHSELRAFSAACAASTPECVSDGACVSLVKAGRTVTWMRGVKAALERRDFAKMPPTPVRVDNAGVISMLQGATLKAANKHIFKDLAESRERVNDDKTVVVVKVDTKDNLANAMTKQEHSLLESAAQLRVIAGPPSV
jgi:hypothetical protein